MELRLFLILILALAVSPTLAQQGARSLLKFGDELELTTDQRSEISEIVRTTVREYKELQSREKGSPSLAGKLGALRQEAQEKALRLLSSNQRRTWSELNTGNAPTRRTTSISRPRSEDSDDRSLIIPTIDELKNPPSPGASLRSPTGQAVSLRSAPAP